MNIKVNDIRPDNLMEQKKPALEHDKKYLRDRVNQFVTVACVACGNDQNIHWANKEGMKYEICPNCETIFMNPRADEALLGEFYKQSKNYEFWNKYIFPQTDSVRKERIFKPRAVRTIEFCKKYDIKGGTLVEIGSAFGTYCESLNELKYFSRVIAVEPTPSLAATCREKGLDVIEATIEELEFPEEQADVIASFEVIEHLSNPANFIEKSIKYLKKGGLFICTCPNGMGLGTLVLKEVAGVVDHEHVNYFNPKSLGILLNRYGLETLEVQTPGELDVDMLERQYLENKSLLANNSFIEKIITSNSEVKSNFQEFLKKNLLSSHLWIIAKKNNATYFTPSKNI
jgi:2-polyprenyl-3-methyl-5-hydroxy-6-metoxy-1,4-benzoquinol methylase